VRALSHAVRYVTWLRTADTPVPVPRVADEEVFVEEPTATGEQPATWLGAGPAAALLSGIGVRSAPWREVRSGREAAAAAHDLGFPLVVKVADPTIVHKTEGRMVHTGVRTRRELSAAVRQLQEAAGPGSPVLVQQQLSGPELAVGVVRDPRFGPLVMVASGGVQLDLWGDQTYLMPPVGPADVRTALQSLRTWPLLTGFRGSPPLDRELEAFGYDPPRRRALAVGWALRPIEWPSDVRRATNYLRLRRQTAPEQRHALTMKLLEDGVRRVSPPEP